MQLMSINATTKSKLLSEMILYLKIETGLLLDKLFTDTKDKKKYMIVKPIYSSLSLIALRPTGLL